MSMSLLSARYGEDDAPDDIAINQIIHTLLSHRSVRHFLSAPLPVGTVETLVAAAQSASTSSNMQTWSVVAVEAPERRARLAELAARQGFIAQAPLFLCWLADLSRLERVGEANGRQLEGVAYFEAFIVALVDAALAAQNAVVAAELGLPPNCAAVFGLAVGYPDPARPAEVKPRLPQAAVLHRERYDAAEEGPVIARYDETLAVFSRSQRMEADSWTGRVIDRVGTRASLRGRDQMREILNALGFGLR